MTTQRVDWLTIVGLGMLMMPLMTMWHEIGGHAVFCVAQGGRASEIGAFYVQCDGLSGIADILVACAGVLVNAILCILAWALWRRARGDLPRLVLWLLWVSQGFVAAGYFCFSGVSGVGDLGTAAGGSLANMPFPLAWRIGETAFGILAYILLVRAAIRGLTAMLGTGPATRTARLRIGYGFYATAGASAVLVGLLNPVGIFITIMSAAASSFGGLAGFNSIANAVPRGDAPRDFVIERSWILFVLGAIVLAGFAVVLGPTLRP